MFSHFLSDSLIEISHKGAAEREKVVLTDHRCDGCKIINNTVHSLH